MINEERQILVQALIPQMFTTNSWALLFFKIRIFRSCLIARREEGGSYRNPEVNCDDFFLSP